MWYWIIDPCFSLVFTTRFLSSFLGSFIIFTIQQTKNDVDMKLIDLSSTHNHQIGYNNGRISNTFLGMETKPRHTTHYELILIYRFVKCLFCWPLRLYTILFYYTSFYCNLTLTLIVFMCSFLIVFERPKKAFFIHCIMYHIDFGAGMILNGGGHVPPSSK